jgi:uncharacterized membrane protein
MVLDDLIATVIGVLVPFIELAGALVIVWGVLHTFIGHLRSSFSLDPHIVGHLRSQMVQSLVLGLEYQVAADVLRTAHAPTWTDIGHLAALIALRTVLNYVLEREAEHLCAEDELAMSATGQSYEELHAEEIEV